MCITGKILFILFPYYLIPLFDAANSEVTKTQLGKGKGKGKMFRYRLGCGPEGGQSYSSTLQ